MDTRELTRLSTQDITKADVVTDSLIISEQFGKQHKIVMRDIRTLVEGLKESLSDNDFNGYKIEPVEYMDKKGELRPYFEMNESFFMMLVMGYNTKKALIIKNEFIKAFMFMKHELTIRKGSRAIGKRVRHDMTKSISNNIPEGNFKSFAYSNYTKLIYKKVLGMQVKKYKELLGLQKKDNARDYLTYEQLEIVQSLESKIANIVEFTTERDPKEVYKEVKIFMDKQIIPEVKTYIKDLT